MFGPAFGLVLLVLLVASGIYLSLYASRRPALVEDLRLHAVLLPAFILLSVWMAISVQSAMPGRASETLDPRSSWPSLAILAMMPVGISWAYYLSQVFSHHLTVTIPRWLRSDHKLKAPVTFDKGDAALKAQDPARALALYRQELDRHPGQPDIYLRMAEAHRALKDGPKASACLGEAALLAQDPHRRGPILLQLSEQRVRDAEAPAARLVLEGLLADPALAPYHAAARARLAALKSPA